MLRPFHYEEDETPFLSKPDPDPVPLRFPVVSLFPHPQADTVHPAHARGSAHRTDLHHSAHKTGRRRTTLTLTDDTHRFPNDKS